MTHMSVTFPESRLIVTRFFGPFDYEDILEWFDTAPLDARFSREFDGLVDLRKARLTSFRIEKVRLLARHVIDRDFTQGTWAVLVDRPAETAFSMIFSSLAAQQHPVAVFSTVAAAASYLGRNLSATGMLYG